MSEIAADMSPYPCAASDALASSLKASLERIKLAAIADPYPSLALRQDRLRRAINQLVHNEQRIVEALSADFGGRPEALSLLTDVMAPVRSLRFALRRVKHWMRPEKRRPDFPMGLLGARASVFYQPLGVIGVMAPWNAPVALSFSPLASALSAGNRVMIKPSELTPNAAELIAEMIGSAFDETEITTVLGGPKVASAFTSQSFDHLIFTGGAGTARFVMRAAAENLVPVTLELGGKSPAIVAKGSNLEYAARKIVNGKLANAGQVCMAPDFALVHRSDQQAFIDRVRSTVHRMYPDLASNADFTRVHLPRQRQRLSSMVEEALACGAIVEVLTGASVSDLENLERFPPVIVIDPPMDIALMREEVFGPILPVLAYDSLEDVVKLLGRLSRPLGLYFLGGTAAEKTFILKRTYAGGVTFDDVMLHPFMQDLGFGGVGESGMGRYLGHDGFKTLSNAKGVVQRPWIDVSGLMAPPFKPTLTKMMRRVIRSYSGGTFQS